MIWYHLLKDQIDNIYLKWRSAYLIYLVFRCINPKKALINIHTKKKCSMISFQHYLVKNYLLDNIIKILKDGLNINQIHDCVCLGGVKE